MGTCMICMKKATVRCYCGTYLCDQCADGTLCPDYHGPRDMIADELGMKEW